MFMRLFNVVSIFITVFVMIVAFMVIMQATANAQDKNDVLDRDFSTMMTWFEGEFDNAEQVYFDGVLNVGPDEEHGRIHSIFKRVDLPAIGENVFYVQQYGDNDPEKIYRQRIYKFTPLYDRHEIALDIFRLADEAAAKDAHLDPSKIAGLTMDDLGKMPAGCRVYWKRQANQFEGYMEDKACSMYSERSKRTLVFSDDLLLTDDQIWIYDRAEDDKGNYVYGNKAGVPHKLLKVHTYTCWIGYEDKNARGEFAFHANQKISNQGGELRFELEGQETTSVSIRMRDVHWPYGPNRNSTVLYAHKNDDPRAVSYVWAEPDAERIALNLRWMQASCTRD